MHEILVRSELLKTPNSLGFQLRSGIVANMWVCTPVHIPTLYTYKSNGFLIESKLLIAT